MQPTRAGPAPPMAQLASPSGRPSPPPPPCPLPPLPGGRTEARRGARPRGLGHLLLPPGHLLLPLVALDPVRDATHPPRPLTLSPSSSLPLALSRAATEHTRRRRRASPRPPSTPCLSDEFRGTAIAFCVVYTNPFDRGSPVASSPSSSPTFGRRQPHRRFAAVSASPSPLSPPLRSL